MEPVKNLSLSKMIKTYQVLIDCYSVLQLLDKLFPTDRFRPNYLENRSRRMEVGIKVYPVVLIYRGRNARNVCIE